MLVSRNKPVNIEPKDDALFQKEYLVNINDPSLVVLKFCLLDIYSFSALHPKRMKLKGGFIFSQLRISKLLRRYTFKKKAVIVLDHWSPNYFHWFTEVIPKILFLQEKNKLPELLIPQWLSNVSFIPSSLAYLPKVNIKWIAGNRNMLLLKAICCKLNNTSGNYLPATIQQIREIYTEPGVEVGTAGVFIYRKPEENRNFLNFPAIEKKLIEYNIKCVDFSLLNWDEQKSIVSQTKLLIGFHGAGLTNMLFLPSDSIVFELRDKTDAQNNCYFSLASACGFKYAYQLCEPEVAGEITQKNNYMLDVDLFAANLQNLLRPKV